MGSRGGSKIDKFIEPAWEGLENFVEEPGRQNTKPNQKQVLWPT